MFWVLNDEKISDRGFFREMPKKDSDTNRKDLQ